MMMPYRKDIQILRGLAVLFVVLYHVQVPGFSAGFLGVDIFFVISGYLMGIMYDPRDKLAFFRKRAVRLLPAYFATIFATLVAAAFLTTPNDFSKVADQALFGVFFTSNVGFWMENSYFDKSSFKPLLHLWSLAVEIQFYLLVPAIAFLCRRSRILLAGLVLGSAACCFLAAAIAPSVAFYLLPFRLWEFLIGFGLAINAFHFKPVPARGIAALRAAALALILVLPLATVDGSAPGFVSGHPGLAALAICTAALMLLRFGIPVWLEGNIAGIMLERLGKYSYSVYLAHFPVIVLVLYQPFSGTLMRAPDAGSAGLVILLIVIASAVLYKLVEAPCRQLGRATWVSAGLAMVVIAALPSLVQVQSSFFPERERLVYDAWSDREDFRCGRFYSLLHRSDISCDLTPDLPNASKRILLVGNSHADAIKPGFLSVARARKVAVRFIVQNSVLMPGGKVNVSELVREAVERNVNAIVLHYSPGAIPAETVEELVRQLAPHEISVSFLLPIPVWKHSVPKMLIHAMRDGASFPVITSASYRVPNIPFERAMRHIVQPGFRIYRTDQVFCQPVCKVLGQDGKPFYFDDAHLTVTGSEQLRPVFERMLDDLEK